MANEQHSGSRPELEAHLRANAGDWDAWLVYSDWLSERGDCRGELIVLEHRLATSAASAEERTRLRGQIDERVVAWQEAWSDHLYQKDDVAIDEHLRLQRECEPLRPVAPRALLEPIDFPIGLLVALLSEAGPDIEEDWTTSPPSLLSDIRLQINAALIAWIEEAFDGAPFPPDDEYSLYQAEAADGYSSCDRSRDHLGRWQDLPEQQLLECEWALVYLGPHGVVYYWPAVMCFDLRYDFNSPDAWITESFGYGLAPSTDHRSHQQERLSRLNREQRAAICAYALLSGNESFSHWARVALAEVDGPRADWFEIFNPV